MMPGGIELLEKAVAELAGEDVCRPGLGPELVDLLRVRSMFDAQISRRVREFEVRGEAILDGHKHPGAWLTANCRIGRGEAYRIVRRAIGMAHLDRIRTSWESGNTTTDHVDAVVDARKNAKADSAFAEYEPTLLDVVECATVADTVNVLARWREALDATRDDTDEQESKLAKDIERRGLDMGETGGVGTLRGTTDALDYAILFEAIEIELERGRVEGDERTLTQQRLDALIAICKRTVDRNDPAGTGRAHLVVRTDEPSLEGTGVGNSYTSTGIRLPGESLRRGFLQKRGGETSTGTRDE